MSIKQAIEALEELVEYAETAGFDWSLDNARAALAALRSMPAEPYAYAVYFPDQPTEELVHDLDELLDDMTNREHTITELFATPPPAPVLSDAEIDAITVAQWGDRVVTAAYRAYARAIEQAIGRASRGGEMSDKLLPCPWCGGDVDGIVLEGDTFRWRKVAGCCADGPEVRHNTLAEDQEAAEKESRQRAIDAWNTRAPTLPLMAAIGDAE